MVNDAPSVRSIFEHALELASDAERAAFLDVACAGQAELRSNVGELLRAHAEAGSFLKSPISEGQPTMAMRPMAEQPGTVIGPYKLLQQIGEGGMGVVFMAEQAAPVKRTVALKIIKPGMDSRQVIARFEAERQAVAMMDHPNIAKVLDAGATESGRPYFVMELVKGVPITKYCDEKQLPLRARLELFTQVCQAVQHAHQKGVIHRDLKPNNVLVAEYDNRAVPKVIDFGVAKATAHRLTERTMFTEFGQVLGTMEYMSPEQAKLNQLDVDTRSDIYSLGVLMYELLAGSTPFGRDRLCEAAFDEMLRIIREEEPPKPSTRLSASDQLPSIAANRHSEPVQLSKAVRGELDWIVMKSLEKDRNRRYETASGFAADVERHLRDEPVLACPPSAAYRFRKLVRRNKLAFLAVSAVAGAVLLGLAVSTWLFVHERAAREQAVSETAKATAINDLLQEMLASANPDGAKGSDYTVRKLLDRFSEGLSGQLKNQPEVEASIRATIGNAYRRLNLTEKAKPQLTAALGLRKQVFGADHPEVAESLLDYAWNLYESGNATGCEDYCRRALVIFKKTNGREAKVVETLSLLQLLLNNRSRFAEAETVAQEALDLGRKHFPEGSQQLADVLHRLASAAIVQHEPERGERLARESVAMHRKFHGENHPETGYGLYHLAWALKDQDRYEEAEPLFREALTIFWNQYDASHGSTSVVLGHLRATLTARGDQAGLSRLEAEVAFRASELVARTDDELLRSIYRANLHRDSGALEKAIVEYTAVIEANPALAEAWGHRAACYLRMNELEKAIADFDEAIDLEPERSGGWSGRAGVHFRQKQWTAAVTDYSKAIELAPRVHTNWYHRGLARMELGEWDNAVQDFTKIVEGWPVQPGGWYLRGAALAQAGHPDRAMADLRRAVTTGYSDVGQLKDDARLESLRSRADFVELSTQVESQQKQPKRQPP